MASKDVNKHFEVIADGKPVYAAHQCFDKNWRGVSEAVPLGRIICCKDCGQHWYAASSFLYECDIWKKVRWYHFAKRRAIVGK